MWFLDHNYVESMIEMFKKVNAKEKLIGWYHSGPKLRASDLQINELFKRYTPNPLLVIIDVQPKESGVPTDAYFAVEEIKDVSCAATDLKLVKRQLLTYYHRTELPHPAHSFTHRQLSRPKKQRKLVSSTCYETSATSPLARCPHELQISCSLCKDCTCACETLVHTCKRYLMVSCLSTTPSWATSKTYSTCCPTYRRPRATARLVLANLRTQ